MHEREIFIRAIQIDDSAGRASFLDEACQDNSELRRHVEELLYQHERDDGFFLDAPGGRFASDTGGLATQAPSRAAALGRLSSGNKIGPYVVCEEIGEGGCGIVYVAEQRHPIERKVALKVIKPGMDSREVIARFEAERQALALMDHPHVARVLEAGTTESGAPYFAMELVHGVPITDFCNRERLTTPERLRLMIDVCHAVEHAHRRGIIHRDLKPKNILVTLHDGRPIPKVIDFGIAKALVQRLTDGAACTALGQMIGTPLYMSPEQAELSGLNVDTRSDVYSLGVVLYELLTGVTPFDRETLKSAGFESLGHLIREIEPLKPSARLSGLENGLRTTVSEQRRIDQRKLSQSLKGDLDWVVMKALAKDRDRRYGSVAALADDLHRYLTNRPVEAGPPSRIYLAKKLFQWHRVALVTCSMVILALMTGILVAFYQRLTTLQALELASTRLLEVQQEKARADTLLYARDVRLAEMAIAQGSVNQGVELLHRHLPRGEETDLRGIEWHYLMHLARSQVSAVQLGTQPLYTLCLSPDRTQAAVAGADGFVRLVELPSLIVVAEFDSGQGEVNHVGYSRDGGTLVSAGDDGTIRLWNLATPPEHADSVWPGKVLCRLIR